MKQDWIACLLLFAASLASHFVVMAFKGFTLTQDFLTLYDPLATAWSVWDFSPPMDAGELFHANYILFVAMIYSVFGKGNHMALIVSQILLASLSTLMIFRVAARHAGSTGIAFGCAAVTFLFFDGMFYNTVGSPESVYRSLFIFFVFGLMQLYEKGKAGAFLCLAAVSFLLLLFIRIDTLILYVPVYLLGLKIVLDRLPCKPAGLLQLTGAIFAILLMVSLLMKLPAPG